MATTRRNHLTTTQARSPFILERRRKLFPIDDYDVDSDLGHIGPLCSDSASDSDSEGVHLISDYDIMDIVGNKKILGNETPVSNKACSEIMSPLELSPYSNTFMKITPKKYSPSHNLKTPHDTSTKPLLQKEQKALLEESKSLKRKSSPSSSPEQSKSMKVDKNSKVRTALFPPENDIYTTLPAKSFYSRNQENTLEKLNTKKDKYSPKYVKFSTGRHSSQYRKKFGQINNGVGHKIRKPKQKKISKTIISKAAKKLLQTGSVLNDYIQDIKDLRNKQNTESKLIVNPTTLKNSVAPIEQINESQLVRDLKLQTTKKLISTPVKQIQNFTEENKENNKDESQCRYVSPPSPSSPKDTISRKFFKSSRSKVSSEPEKYKKKPKDLPNKTIDVKSGDRKSLHQSLDIDNTVFLETSNDFQDEDMEPDTNISNILSILSDESPEKQIFDQNERKSAMLNFEKRSETAFDIPKSNVEVLNVQGNVVSQNIDEKCIVNQNEHGISGHFQNGCYSDFNISLRNFDTSGPGTAVMSEYQLGTAMDANSEGSGTTGYKNIDDLQDLQTNNDNLNNSWETNRSENAPYILKSDQVTRLSCLGGTLGEFNVNLQSTEQTYNSNTFEPCIVSSQVVFDGILLEDANQTALSSLSNQNGSFSTVFNDTNPLVTNEISNYTNRITLEAHNSVLASENSIQLHQNNVANMILSPISQMCDVASGLALNSPKRGRKSSPALNNMSRASKILSFTNFRSIDMEQQQQKLFPLFYQGAKGAPDRGEKRERRELKRGTAKKFKALHEDQMLLDAGQKKFGYTVCDECKIVYHMGDPGDEIEHMNYHNASHILRFGGWKNEHIVADFHKSGRIIRVLPTDSKIWLKKVKDLLEFVKRELGCYEMEYDITGSQVYLYIKNRIIAGCAVAAIPTEGGHRMLSSVSGVAMCSEESYPIKCGISHIWVAANFRKQRIGTALIDAVKSSFIYGCILKDDDVALTSPTEAGSAFAEKYFKTPNYLVYYT